MDQTGNIYDGNHGARAAAEAGEMVEVIEIPNAQPGANFVTDLPVIGQ